MPDFLRMLLISIGAFMFWAIDLFKGSFNDQMSGPYEYDFKYYRNLFVGLIVLSSLLFLVVRIIK